MRHPLRCATSCRGSPPQSFVHACRRAKGITQGTHVGHPLRCATPYRGRPPKLEVQNGSRGQLRFRTENGSRGLLRFRTRIANLKLWPFAQVWDITQGTHLEHPLRCAASYRGRPPQSLPQQLASSVRAQAVSARSPRWKSGRRQWRPSRPRSPVRLAPAKSVALASFNAPAAKRGRKFGLHRKRMKRVRPGGRNLL